MAKPKLDEEIGSITEKELKSFLFSRFNKAI